MDERHPDRVVAARNGSPLILGVGDREMFLASDLSALVRHTTSVVHLDDGELATVTGSEFRTFSREEENTGKSPTSIDLDVAGRRTPTATGTTCTRRSWSSRRPSSGCCGAGWTSGSARRGWTG